MARIADSRFWNERTPRERSILIAGGALLLLLLIWFVLVDPAIDGRARWRKDLPQLRADAANRKLDLLHLERFIDRALNVGRTAERLLNGL